MDLQIAEGVLLGGCALGVLYLCVAAYAVGRFAAEAPVRPTYRPAVTVLKPLCGDEPELYENLRSFCEQDYPEFQVVFGVKRSSDPAVAVVERLMADLPTVDLTLVSGGRDYPNGKVANLENMMTRVNHGVLVVADSDIRVRPDYLSSVVQPLADPAVGLVTCAFAGSPTAGIWSRLRAMWFNHAFLPSVLFSRLAGVPLGCFGSTMVLRRGDLERIGGFAAIRDRLADDHALGAAIRRTGRRVVLSSYLVHSTVSDEGFGPLLLHELRWGRTIRSIAPIGYAASGVTHPVALAVVALLLPAAGLRSLLVLAGVVAVRLWMVRRIDRALNLSPAPLWLAPVRDLLSLFVLVASLWGSRVVWRKRNLRMVAGGRLAADHRSA